MFEKITSLEDLLHSEQEEVMPMAETHSTEEDQRYLELLNIIFDEKNKF